MQNVVEETASKVKLDTQREAQEEAKRMVAGEIKVMQMRENELIREIEAQRLIASDAKGAQASLQAKIENLRDELLPLKEKEKAMQLVDVGELQRLIGFYEGERDYLYHKAFNLDYDRPTHGEMGERPARETGKWFSSGAAPAAAGARRGKAAGGPPTSNEAAGITRVLMKQLKRAELRLRRSDQAARRLEAQIMRENDGGLAAHPEQQEPRHPARDGPPLPGLDADCRLASSASSSSVRFDVPGSWTPKLPEGTAKVVKYVSVAVRRIVLGVNDVLRGRTSQAQWLGIIETAFADLPAAPAAAAAPDRLRLPPSLRQWAAPAAIRRQRCPAAAPRPRERAFERAQLAAVELLCKVGVNAEGEVSATAATSELLEALVAWHVLVSEMSADARPGTAESADDEALDATRKLTKQQVRALTMNSDSEDSEYSGSEAGDAASLADAGELASASTVARDKRNLREKKRSVKQLRGRRTSGYWEGLLSLARAEFDTTVARLEHRMGDLHQAVVDCVRKLGEVLAVDGNADGLAVPTESSKRGALKPARLLHLMQHDTDLIAAATRRLTSHRTPPVPLPLDSRGSKGLSHTAAVREPRAAPPSLLGPSTPTPRAPAAQCPADLRDAGLSLHASLVNLLRTVKRKVCPRTALHERSILEKISKAEAAEGFNGDAVGCTLRDVKLVQDFQEYLDRDASLVQERIRATLLSLAYLVKAKRIRTAKQDLGNQTQEEQRAGTTNSSVQAGTKGASSSALRRPVSPPAEIQSFLERQEKKLLVQVEKLRQRREQLRRERNETWQQLVTTSSSAAPAADAAAASDAARFALESLLSVRPPAAHLPSKPAPPASLDLYVPDHVDTKSLTSLSKPAVGTPTNHDASMPPAVSSEGRLGAMVRARLRKPVATPKPTVQLDATGTRGAKGLDDSLASPPVLGGSKVNFSQRLPQPAGSLGKMGGKRSSGGADVVASPFVKERHTGASFAPGGAEPRVGSSGGGMRKKHSSGNNESGSGNSNSNSNNNTSNNNSASNSNSNNN
ncbi:hypothetical protein DIPPA_34559, partial [Diplonema papillatum]